MNDIDTGLAQAEQLDRSDALHAQRARFALPTDAAGESLLYFAGNSLGLQPRRAHRYVNEELDAWRQLGVEGHFHAPRPWMPYHERLTPPAARLVGALETEIVHMNTLTVNLHLLMVSFYRPDAQRHKILIEKPAFPSDRYAVVSQLRFHGLDPADALIEVEPCAGAAAIDEDDIAATIEAHGKSIALVLLPGVQYYSGQVFDMARIAGLAHRHGCTVGFDLAHAVGNVPLELHDWNVDFAAWCTYKYLNAGPGAIAGAFVHERFAQDRSLPRFAGWWGHDKRTRFRMGPDFEPIPGAEGWALSNPPILSLAPVLASLELFDEVGMKALRDKSERLTAYLDALVSTHLSGQIEIITPSARGCQLSLRLRQAGRGREVQRELIERGVICDWREPDVIRVAPVPFYNRYVDVYRLCKTLQELLAK